jgi:DNA repair exonuclease SbcCD ATPase subunit
MKDKQKKSRSKKQELPLINSMKESNMIQYDSSKLVNIYKLDLPIIKYIYHLADIHIRPAERIQEYTEVFNTLYKSVEEIGKDHYEESVVIIAGDIFDAKSILKSESLYLFDKLMELLNLMNVIIIAGNHDGNMTNQEKQDSLSYVAYVHQRLYRNKGVKNQLYYLNKTGIYETENLIFGVKHIFDFETKFPTIHNNEYIPDIIKNSSKKKIAIYHGTINGSKTDLGKELISEENVNMFNGYDYVLLGDIHKHQYLTDEYNIAYSSSLIQQNHGETIEDHGYMLWDLVNNMSYFVRVPNNYGYITIYIKDDKIQYPYENILTITTLPNNLNIRIIYENTKFDFLRKLKEGIYKKFKVLSYIEKVYTINLDNYKIEEEQNEDVYEKAMNEYINLNKISINNAKLIREEISKLIKKKTNNLTRYRIKKLCISDILCYGENNEIDFTKHSNIIGIFSKNYTGKSSIIDCICECLFNDNTKRITKNNIIRYGKSNGYIKLEIEINGIGYIIERIYKRNKPIKINLYQSMNNKIELLNEDTVIKTMKYIGSLIGDLNKYMQTDLISQSDNNGIADLTKDQRRKFLKDIFDLNNFTEKCKEYSDLIMSTKMEIAVIERENKILMETLEKYKSFEDLEMTEQKIKETTDKLKVLKDGLINFDDKYIKNKTKGEIDRMMNQIEKEIDKYKNEIINIETTNNMIDQKILEIKIPEDYITKHNEYEIDKIKNITEKEIKIEQLKGKKHAVKKYNIQKINEDYKLINKQYETNNESYINLSNKLKEIEKILNNINVNYSEEIEKSNEEYIKTKNMKLKEILKKIKAKKEIKKYDEKQIIENLNQVNNNLDELNKLTDRKGILEETIKRYEEYVKIKYNLENLENIRYNELCEICVENNKETIIRRIELRNKLNTFNEFDEGNINEKELMDITNRLNDIKQEELYKQKSILDSKILLIEENKKNIEYNESIQEMNEKYEEEYNKLNNENNEEYIKYKKELDSSLVMKNELEKQKREIENNILKMDLKKIIERKENLEKLIEEYKMNEKQIIENDEIEKQINILIKELSIMKESKDEEYNNIVDMVRKQKELIVKKSKLEMENQKCSIKLKENEDNLIQIREQLEIQNKNNKILNEIQENEKQLIELNKNCALIQRDIEDSKNKEIVLENNRNNLKILLDNLDKYVVLKNVFDKNGISDIILRFRKEQFIKGISSLTNMICEYEFDIDNEWNFMIKRGEKIYNIENCSGAEKLILNMAFRLTFSSMDDRTKSNIMIIDESFVSFDKDKRETIKDIIGMILTKYEKVLVISHMEEMQNIIPDRIEIKVENGVSKIY